MRFILTVDTGMRVGTGLTLMDRGNRRIYQRVTIAAGSKSTVILFMMWAPTDRANDMRRFASHSGMIPLAAMLAKWNAHMNTGRVNDTREALN